MITHLQLENFKIWRNTGPIALKPVTLLLGTNSSGKSSLIQSLLLIRQTVKDGDDNQDLNLGNPDAGDSVTLGRFLDVLCRNHTDKPRIGIEFQWSPTGEPSDIWTFSAKYMNGPAGGAVIENLRMGQGENSFISERSKPGIYKLQVGSKRGTLKRGTQFRPIRSFTFSLVATLFLGGENAKVIRGAGSRLAEELSRIIYLGPVRRLAQRDYVWSGNAPSSIGDDGAKAIDALIASGIVATNAKKRGKEPHYSANLFENTKYWLKEMNLGDDLSVRALGGSTRYELLIHKDGQASNLKDVGVGVSQVLPVIVAALFAKKGHIVIVEEPESHLHPLAQSVLANLFATVSKERNVQFIVETHSEHLFRRMQTLMAKGELKNEQAAMYFVKREGKIAELVPLEANSEGYIKNWPKDFFGDAMGEAMTHQKAAIDKRKKDTPTTPEPGAQPERS